MDPDMELSHLEQLPDDDDDSDNDNDHEYDSYDDGAVRALLTQNTQTRGQGKEPAATTLRNQIGRIVVEVSISASCPSTF